MAYSSSKLFKYIQKRECVRMENRKGKKEGYDKGTLEGGMVGLLSSDNSFSICQIYFNVK